ncbi:MAG: hypothetical protein ACXW5U_30205 [Thermoanaerobaculia bacterium]
MARHILDHRDQYYMSIPPEHALDLVEAARVAAHDGEPYVRCRAEKDLAVILSYLARFANAKAAICCAEALADESFASGAHKAVIAFARAVLYDTMDDQDQTTHWLKEAISAFEANGAYDRSYKAREYDAFRRAWRGDHAYALPCIATWLAARGSCDGSVSSAALTTISAIAIEAWAISRPQRCTSEKPRGSTAGTAS